MGQSNALVEKTKDEKKELSPKAKEKRVSKLIDELEVEVKKLKKNPDKSDFEKIARKLLKILDEPKAKDEIGRNGGKPFKVIRPKKQGAQQ